MSFESNGHSGPQSLIRLQSLIGSSGFWLLLKYMGFFYWCPISGYTSDFSKIQQRYITWYGFLATSLPFSSSSPAFLFAFPSQSAAKWPIWPQTKHLFCWPGVNTTWKVAMPKDHSYQMLNVKGKPTREQLLESYFPGKRGM